MRVRVQVAAGVFVPRQRSALLVRLATAHLRAPDQPHALLGVSRAPRSGTRPPEPPAVVDLGCGTGALGAVVAHEVPEAEVWAIDVDPAAVACARCNLPPARVLLGDLYAPLPETLRGRVEVLLANAPYVPTAEIALMPPEARDHEHTVALDGGVDGLDVQRRVIADAGGWLRPGGVLLVESSREQAPRAAALMRAAGLRPRVHTDDDIDATAVAGTA